MKTSIRTTILIFATALALGISANSQDAQPTKQSEPVFKGDSVLFNSLVIQYALSIDNADTVLASKIWSHTPEISFINPRGTAYGWNGVKNIIKMFGENFSARKLSCFDVKVANYGDFAWLAFYWVFDATLLLNNSPVQTKGRETQIWRKSQNEWRLVHVHYSGMPVTGQD